MEEWRGALMKQCLPPAIAKSPSDPEVDLADGTWFVDGRLLAERVPGAPAAKLSNGVHAILYAAPPISGWSHSNIDDTSTATLEGFRCTITHEGTTETATLYRDLAVAALFDPVRAWESTFAYRVTPKEGVDGSMTVDASMLVETFRKASAFDTAPIELLGEKFGVDARLAEHLFGRRTSFTVDSLRLQTEDGQLLTALSDTEGIRFNGPASVLNPLFASTQDTTMRVTYVLDLATRFFIEAEVTLTAKQQAADGSWTGHADLKKPTAVSRLPGLP